MAYKHIRRWSTLLVMREVQIKTTMFVYVCIMKNKK